MKKYLLKRLLLMIPTFMGITLITYVMVRNAPGDFTSLRAGIDGQLKVGSIGREIMEQERRLYGLDKPFLIGYAEWFGRLVRLDLGVSRRDGRPVSAILAERLPITLALNIISIFIMYMISIPLGIAAAVKKDGAFDRLTGVVMFVLYSLPAFWVGLVLLLFFAGGEYLNWFPLAGKSSEWAEQASFFPWLGDRIWHLVLPVATLTYGEFAFLSRYTRANILDVINQQYIMTARSKGLTEKRVVFIHAFRNSLIPLITLVATLLPGLLGGSVVVESIFSIPGIGLWAFESILSRDLPSIMAITAISAFLTLVSILIADITYALADPRIRLEYRL